MMRKLFLVIFLSLFVSSGISLAETPVARAREKVLSTAKKEKEKVLATAVGKKDKVLERAAEDRDELKVTAVKERNKVVKTANNAKNKILDTAEKARGKIVKVAGREREKIIATAAIENACAGVAAFKTAREIFQKTPLNHAEASVLAYSTPKGRAYGKVIFNECVKEKSKK